MIVIGADTHESSHALAAVDAATGRVVANKTVSAKREGMLAAWRWAHALDHERVWTIEDCRHVSGRLERCLIGQGERVVRVAPKLMGESRRGERQLNCALHRIAVTRARTCPQTRAYLDRKLAEGKTKPEAYRYLKRHLARHFWRLLRRDHHPISTATTRPPIAIEAPIPIACLT